MPEYIHDQLPYLEARAMLAAQALAAVFHTTGALTEDVEDPVQIVFLVTGGDKKRVASVSDVANRESLLLG